MKFNVDSVYSLKVGMSIGTLIKKIALCSVDYDEFVSCQDDQCVRGTSSDLIEKHVVGILKFCTKLVKSLFFGLSLFVEIAERLFNV